MDTLKATCFQLQIIAACGLQRSAGNASAYSFPPSAQFRSFPALLTAALCSEGFYQESHTWKRKNGKESQTTGAPHAAPWTDDVCSLLQVPDQHGSSARSLKQPRAQAGPAIKTQNFNAAQWNTGLSEESLKNQRTQTPSAETQGARRERWVIWFLPIAADILWF